MSDGSEIVGHKSFYEGAVKGFRHEPLTRTEADAIMAAADAQQKARAEAMPTEEAAVRALADAVHRLRELGWRDSCYAPKDVPILMIEPGSSGIHRGTQDGEWPNQRFWIHDAGDMWPSRPCLFKEVK